MEENFMSEEAFKELIDNLETINNLTLYARKNIKYYFNKLLKENEKLKASLDEISNINFPIIY